MRKCIVLFICIAGLQQVFCQQSQKLKFHSLQQVGLINGTGAVSGFLQTVNGVEVNNWFIGVGAGLDFYRYRSVPLFIDAKKYFNLKNRNRLYVYADGGYNMPWLPDKKQTFFWGNGVSETKSKYKGGLYIDAGAGYAIKFKSGSNMHLGVGYSYKFFEETRTTKSAVSGVGGTIETINAQKFDYSFKRLMIKIGWEF